MYNINELALMTGFTTRTLRNYIKQGFLIGEKVDGAWRFSEENIHAFWQTPAVRAALQAKRNGIVCDFLSDRRKQTNAMCVILDLRAGLEEARRVSDFFCDAVNTAHDVQMAFTVEGGCVRVILSGVEDSVQPIIGAYYEQAKRGG